MIYLPILFKVASLAWLQSYDFSGVSDVILNDVGEQTVQTHQL